MSEPKEKRCIDYVYTEMCRADIAGAPYNPRKIKDSNRSNLKNSLKRFGMVESVVVNKRSADKGWSNGELPTLVGGHQRLSVLDEKNKTDRYIIGVNMIDVDEKEEKALNLALNNKNLQGDYDVALLQEMAEQGTDLEQDGFFNKVDMEVMFGFPDAVTKDLVDDTFRDAMKRNEAARDKQGEADVNYDRVHDRKKIMIVFESNRSREIFDGLIESPADSAFIRGEELISILTEWKQNARKGE